MASTKTITLAYGATEVTLEYVLAETVSPEESKNFTEHVLENNARVRDDAGSPKKRWVFTHDVPLSSDQKTAINTLYSVNATITLTENFFESGTTYQVHFENKRVFYNSPNGDAHYELTFQEV